MTKNNKKYAHFFTKKYRKLFNLMKIKIKIKLGIKAFEGRKWKNNCINIIALVEHVMKTGKSAMGFNTVNNHLGLFRNIFQLLNRLRCTV